MSQPPHPALPPRFRDLTYLAAGAFGHVYRAETAQGPCAVKVLAPEWLGDAEAVWRFAGEYRRLATLAHPALPAALEEGLTEDGSPYFAMEFKAGETLEALAPLDVETARSTLALVAEALAYLHGRGLVHGDLKAANVLLHDGAVALLDVGSAMATHQRRESVSGTPEYMAPEVLARADAAPAADWYALGCLGYELLSGQTPFVSGEAGAAGVVRAQLFESPPEASMAPPALAGAIASLLLKDPAARLAALPEAFAALGLAAPASEGLREGWLARPEAETAWEHLSAPEGTDAVAVLGPAGAGKSRTLDALRLQARLAGHAWVAAGCAGAGDAPGAVARVVLRQALALAGLPPTPAVAAWLAGGLLPAWLDLEPRARKLSLFGALAEAWAGAVAALGGLYVGLDDWHQADAASRELVQHLRQAASGRHARWCFALEGEAERGEASAVDLPPGAPLVALAAWQPAEVEALVARRLGARPPAALLQALALAQGTTPGLVNALLEHWAATGALAPHPDGWRFSLPAGSTAGDPWDRLWSERIARLAPDALALARLLAIAHAAGPVPAWAAGQVLGFAAGRTQAALDGLAAAGLTASQGGQVRLAVPSQAEGLARGLAAEAAGLSTSLAKLVLGPELAPEAAPLDQLVTATRLALAGADAAYAVELAAVASRRTLEQLALEQAVAILAAARARLGPEIAPATRLAILLSGGEAERLCDRLDAAAADLEQASELAEALGADAAAGQALLSLGKIRQLRGSYDEALAYAGRAEAAAARAGKPALAARAAVLRARGELFTVGHAAARASCARAVDLALAGDAPAMRAAALNLQGVLLIQDEPGERDTALAMIREAIALAESVGDLVGVAAALENLGNAFASLGELEQAREAFQRDADHCRAHGIGTEGLTGEMNLALTLAGLGETSEALALASTVAERARGLKRAFVAAVADAAYGAAAWRAGAITLSLETLTSALDAARAIENRYAEAYIRLERVDAFLAAGEGESARAELEVAVPLAREMELTEASDRLAIARAELARLEGDLAEAAALARPYAAGANPALALGAHGVLGKVALDEQDLPAARRHFEVCLATARTWQASWHLAAARWGLARAASDPAEARAQAREALAPGPNLFARAGAACLLALDEGVDPAGREALDALELALAELPDAARESVLAAQQLPSSFRLAGLPRRAASLSQHSLDLTGWLDALLRCSSEGELHQAILTALTDLTHSDRGYLLGYERGRLLEVVTLGVDYAEELAQGFSTTIVEEALFTGEAVYLVDAATDERWAAAQSVQALGLRTVIAVPYATEGQVLGVVYMDRQAIEPIADAATLSALTLLASLAASRALGFRREAALADELAFEQQVTDAALAVAAGRPAREVLLVVARALTTAQRGYWLARSGTGEWHALAASGAEPFRPDQISRSVLAQAIEEGEPLCLIETDRPESWTPGQSLLALGIRMVWCLPVGEAEALYLDTQQLDTAHARQALNHVEHLVARFAELLGLVAEASL